MLGPPGAGKGTQAKTLAQKLKLTHISTGDLLRQNVSGDTDLGRQAVSFMNKGILVPDELVTQMLKQRLTKADVGAGFILDGYPRNINQAKTLDDLLREKNRQIDLVFYLDTSVEVIIQRLSGRLVCASCGVNFHIQNMPPKKNGICDNCGGKLYQRSDDKKETVKRRLEVYQEEVSSLLEYYRRQDKLQRVVADEEADIVLQKMIRFIKEHTVKTL